MQPTSILGDVRGFSRDYALDQLPRGYVWDLVDYIPRRRGARLECRSPWAFFSPSSLAGLIQGGLHATFPAGSNLLVHGSPNLYDVNRDTGVATSVGTLFSSLRQNGVMLNDRAYFFDGGAIQKPKYLTRTGATLSAPTALPASAPVASLGCAYKDRLVLSGNPAAPSRVYFSELDTDGGPPGTWDATAYTDSTRAVTALWPMSSQILVFHDGSIEKLRGSIPPGVDRDNADMGWDPFSEQMGCNDPASVVGWQENVLWAAPRGVYLSDGSTIRSLTDQGGIGDLWRTLYALKRTGTQVIASVFLDLLFVSVLTDWTGTTPADVRPFTLVCDLSERSWYRFANVAMTAAIPSNVDGEEVWWSPDGVGYAAGMSFRLAKLSPMLFGERELEDLKAPFPRGTPIDAVDGNGRPVLPQVETSFNRLGPEGVKRTRHILVSHTTEQAVPTGANLLRVSYRMRPAPFAPYFTAGDIPGGDDYIRHRLRLGKRGYGVTIKVEQILPTYLSRLHDISVNEWPQDRGKL